MSPTTYRPVLLGFKHPELKSKCGPQSKFSCLAYKETNTSTPRTLVQVLDLGPENFAWQCASSGLPSVTYNRCSPVVLSFKSHTEMESRFAGGRSRFCCFVPIL